MKGNKELKPFYKNLALWLVISLIMIMVFNVFNNPKTSQHDIIFSDFIELVNSGQIQEVTIQGHNISGHYGTNTFKTYAPDDPNLIELLRSKGVKISAKPEETPPIWQTLIISWFPMLLLIGVWIFFMRQMQGGGGKAMSFGKSRAKLLTENQKKVTFKDVAGAEEAKAELEEIINFLREPKRFTRLGGKIPKGVLLVGPPGTGKTLMAKAVAGEAEVPFFSISGSDFVEMFVGVGASRVRDLFNQGKKNAPCLIFIDEIDAVGRHRGAGLGGGHDEREQTLNQLLVEMDGFESNEGVILIAATNRDLEKEVANGQFRSDLYYRLSVFPIHLPPLRERGADIILLADYFVQQLGEKLGKKITRIDSSALDLLISYHWPGNVRELQNCLERAVLLAADGIIHGYLLPPSLQAGGNSESPPAARDNFQKMVQAYETSLIIDALKKAKGNQTKAAMVLGTSKRVIQYKISQYHIDYRKYSGIKVSQRQR